MVAGLCGLAGTTWGQELELEHADFHGRLGMKIQVLAGKVAPNVTLKATLTSDKGLKQDVGGKMAPTLSSRETLVLDLRALPADVYTLTVELSDGRRAIRTWTKPYDGIPRVGLDENNAVCVGGKPFFPVLCKGIGTETDVAKWAPYVNTLKHVAFIDKQYTPEGFKGWLDLAARYKLMAIGPGRGYWWPHGGAVVKYTAEGKSQRERSFALEKLDDYIRVARDHEAFLMYEWTDEPELDNADNCIPAAEVRRATDRCHELDAQHLHFCNMAGYGFARPEGNWMWKHVRSYTYLYGQAADGRKTLMADVLSQDYYPIENADDVRYKVSFENMCVAMDTMRAWNADLAPIIACVETCDITKAATPAPTAAELRLLCWANIIHGAKGISWFHYFKPTPEENFREMARFKEQVTRLTPAVLGPDYPGRVSCQATNDGRVDVLAKSGPDGVYLFAANLKRQETVATFTLDRNVAESEVVDENRRVPVKDRAFSDTFKPLEVHIYRIAD